MRFPVLLSCILMVVCAVPAVNAQEPPLPQPDSETAPPPANAPQLIPDDVLPAATPVPSLPTLPQLDEVFKDNPLTQAASDQRARIEWRKLRNAATNDPAVKAARAKAEAARTDLEKRKLLRAYYELLFSKMIARASSPAVHGYLNDRKNDHLKTLPQPRVRPETVSLGPTPPPPAAAQPKASPSPTPQPSVSPPIQVLPFATPTPASR